MLRFTWSCWLPIEEAGKLEVEDSKTHCVAGGTRCFVSLRVEAAPVAGQHAVGNPPCREGVWRGPCPLTT